MKIRGRNGNAFDLVVLRYENPDVTEDRWDANWLVVSGTVTTGDQSWRFVDPCVTTFELAELAEWLDGLNWHESSECAFTEPNLAFAYSPSPDSVLRIRFAHESAPPWIRGVEERLEGVTLEFPMRARDAADAAAALRNTLVDYPIRGGAA